METANFGSSMASSENPFSDFKSQEIMTISSRGSVDRRKEISPSVSKIAEIAPQESTLILKKVPKGLKLNGVMSGPVSPRDTSTSKKQKIIEKKNLNGNPVKLLRSKKCGSSSSLAMRHSSPQTISSFAQNTNISNSNMQEITQMGNFTQKKLISIHQKVHLKRTSESQMHLRSNKKSEKDESKKLLNVTNKIKKAQKEENIIREKPIKHLERVKSDPKIQPKISKLNDSGHRSSKNSAKPTGSSKPNAPRCASSQGFHVNSPKQLNSPSKCIFLLLLYKKMYHIKN